MEEKRRFPRTELSAGVTWRRMDDPSDTSENNDVAKNISPYGICLITYENLEIGERISMGIELPNHRLIKASGKVIWSKKFGASVQANYDTGIEFTEIGPEDRRLLKQLVLFPQGDGR